MWPFSFRCAHGARASHGAAPRAAAPKHHVMPLDGEVGALGGVFDGGLERGVLERQDLAAAHADKVVVVLAARQGGLEAGYAAPEVQALNKAEADQQVEDAVHARDADAAVVGAQLVEDLLCGAAAFLVGERIDDRLTGAAGPVAGPAHRCRRMLGPPFRGCRVVVVRVGGTILDVAAGMGVARDVNLPAGVHGRGEPVRATIRR